MGLEAGMNKSLAVLPALKRNGVKGGTRCGDREVKKERLQTFLKKAHDLKLMVHFYTVNDMESLVRLIYAGADGVFTNRIDALIQACGRMKKAKIEASLSYPKQSKKKSVRSRSI